MNVIRFLQAFAICAACMFAFADTIELRNGQKAQGTFKQADSNKVSITVGNQLIQFDTKDVKYILFVDDQNINLELPFFKGKDTVLMVDDNKLLADALTSLKSLRSVVNSNPTYRDFSSRVMDARITVDRYLNDEKFKNDKSRTYVSDAMSLYALGGLAWGATAGRTQGDFNTLASLGAASVLSKFPNILSEADILSKRAKRNTWEYGFAIANNLKLIFDAASIQIDSCQN